MKIIGITGGVGAGKTELLHYISQNYCCDVLFADEVAHRVKEPGQPCYEALVSLLGTGILLPDGTIDKGAMAEMIFRDETLRLKVNQCIHPAVKNEIVKRIEEERAKNRFDFLFIEAALLVEDGYQQLVDELWYIYADRDIRRERLKTSRAYSDEKIEGILASQLSDEAFRQHCKILIDNGKSFEEACRQIDRELEEYL